MSLETAVIPRRNEKQVMQNLGGGGSNKVPCRKCGSAELELSFISLYKYLLMRAGFFLTN